MTLSLLELDITAQALLDCVCEALDRIPVEVPGLAGCPCRVGIVPGAPAADGCDGGCNVPEGEYPGQLTVNVVRTYVAELPVYTNLQAVLFEGANCGPTALTVADLSITLWRCTPVPSDDGCPPPMEDLKASATQLHADMMAISQALTCCFPTRATDRRKGRRFSPGQSTVLDPQGGCVGVQTTVTVALDGLSVPIPVAP